MNGNCDRASRNGCTSDLVSLLQSDDELCEISSVQLTSGRNMSTNTSNASCLSTHRVLHISLSLRRFSSLGHTSTIHFSNSSYRFGELLKNRATESTVFIILLISQLLQHFITHRLSL